MKTRNGFVSNSSSSSFVVAFPHRPKNILDLHYMMYGDTNTKIECYDDTMDTMDIVKRVFDSMKNKRKLNIKKIAGEFAGRYYYCASHNVYGIDEKGEHCSLHGWGYHPSELSFGTDKQAMIELAKLWEAMEAENNGYWKEYHAKRQKVAERLDLSYPLDYNDKNYKRDSDILEEAVKQDVDFQNWQKKHYKESHDYYRKIERLNDKVALSDATDFYIKNKDCCIMSFEFSDNEGESLLEHGDIFRNLPYIRISHH